MSEPVDLDALEREATDAWKNGWPIEPEDMLAVVRELRAARRAISEPLDVDELERLAGDESVRWEQWVQAMCAAFPALKRELRAARKVIARAKEFDWPEMDEVLDAYDAEVGKR